jgi:hypothetical protein
MSETGFQCCNAPDGGVKNHRDHSVGWLSNLTDTPQGEEPERIFSMKNVYLQVAVVSLFAVGSMTTIASASDNDIKYCRGFLEQVKWPEPGKEYSMDDYHGMVNNNDRKVKRAKYCFDKQLDGKDQAAFVDELNKAIQDYRDKRKKLVEASDALLARTKKIEAELKSLTQDCKRLGEQLNDPNLDGAALKALEERVGKIQQKAKEMEQQSDYRSSAWYSSFTKVKKDAERALERGRVLAAQKDQLRTLEEGAAIKRMASYSQEDVYDLKKVEAAFLSATKDQIFYFNKEQGRPDYHPTPAHAQDVLDAKSLKLTSLQLEIWNGVRPYSDKSKYESMNAHTPSILWSVDGSWGFFVAFDGAVYRTRMVQGGKPAFSTGTPPRKSWPKPAQNLYLSTGDLQVYEGAGLIPKGTIKKLESGRDALNKCTARISRKFDPAYKKIERANITERTRENRLDQLDAKVARQMHRTCKGMIRKINSIVGKVVKKRKNQRLTLAKRVASHLAKFK